MKYLLPIILVAFIGAAQAQAPRPERVVDGTTVISSRNPRIHIEMPATAQYLGAERWNLYDVADCEIHVFVDAGKDRVVKRLYWIQFEGHLYPQNHYDYSKDEPRVIQGMDFRVRARFGPTSEAPKPGSDLEHVLKMIANAGYELPADMMNVRLVHLPDEAHQRELMVIYSEDLAPTGLTAAELRHGNEPAPAWRPIEAALIERAAKRVRFIR